MMTSFVPRPVYRIKSYGYQVQPNDSPSRIAQRFGVGEAGVRELVAANLFGRDLMPMALGSPYSWRTFASLEEGEVLRVPASWPDPAGMPASVGDPNGLGTVYQTVPDPIAAAISTAVNAMNAASGNPYDANTIAAITNTAVQWYLNSAGTSVSADPSVYQQYVASATNWVNAYSAMAQQQGATPAQVATFPWAPFLAMLPAASSVDITSVNWGSDTVPGTNGAVPWASVPWGYLAQVGANLETIKTPVVQWPTSGDPATVLAAFQTAVAAAGGSTGGGGTTSPGSPCPSGSVYDPGGPTPGCQVCDNPGQTYDLVTHKCICPAGQMFDTIAGKCLPPPASQADCTQYGEVWDDQGPVAGPHCYTCEGGATYSAPVHGCVCPAGQQMTAAGACIAATTPGPGPLTKSCPSGFSLDATNNCVANTTTPAKTTTPPGPTTALSSTGSWVKDHGVALAAGGVGLVALGTLGYFAMRKPKGGKTAEEKMAAKKAR